MRLSKREWLRQTHSLLDNVVFVPIVCVHSLVGRQSLISVIVHWIATINKAEIVQLCESFSVHNIELERQLYSVLRRSERYYIM